MLVDKMVIFTKLYLVNVLTLSLLKTPENFAFSTAFRGYEMKILAIKELITKGQYTSWKLSVFRVFLSDPYFSAFRLNMERFSVPLCIQPECVKIRTRKTPNTDNFHTVIDSRPPSLLGLCHHFHYFCYR